MAWTLSSWVIATVWYFTIEFLGFGFRAQCHNIHKSKSHKIGTTARLSKRGAKTLVWEKVKHNCF